jgi:hypothetical protein
MTAPNPGAARNSWPRRVGQALVYLVTGGLNVVALACALFLWAALSTGDYRTDHDMLENDGIWLKITGLFGTVVATLSLALDWGGVRLRWMPRWTLAIPAVLLVATLLAWAATAVG